MKYLLIGGAPNVGKSETIWQAAQNLINNGFTIVAGSIQPPPMPTVNSFPDFKIIVEGVNKLGDTVWILINSATDDPQKIDELKQFFEDNKRFDVSIIITSVRDGAGNLFWPRPDFFTKMNIIVPQDFFVEIPLARITRINDKDVALNWYRNANTRLIEYTLSNVPYNV